MVLFKNAIRHSGQKNITDTPLWPALGSVIPERHRKRQHRSTVIRVLKMAKTWENVNLEQTISEKYKVNGHN